MARFSRFAVRASLAGLLLCGALSASDGLAQAAGLTGPTAEDRQITLAIVSQLGREHLSRHPLDDEISQRTLKSFLKALDPWKSYFTQADVDEFKKSETALDDMARRGDTAFAYKVYNVFLQRVEERMALVSKILDTKHDFTVDEEMVTDQDKLTYPRTDAEIQDVWRKRIKYDILVQKSDGKSEEEAIKKLRRRYHSFAERMRQTDRDELLEMYLTSLTTSYDPHTTYMSPGTQRNFNIQMRLNLDGIGAALQSEDGDTTVSKIVPGGAADKDGRLKPKDKVIGVGQGAEGEIVDVVNMKLNDIVDKIRGKAGTIVRLQVVPEGKTETVIYNITRAKIELKDSEARGEVFEQGKKADGSPYKVGWIDLPSFYMDMEAARRQDRDFKSTTRDMRKLLDDFRGKKVDAVVVDLRKNGGGSLTEAINLTGLFIDQGPVVQVKDAAGNVQHYDDLDKGVAWGGPLVVLTSKFSASASEIFAGAIQDYGRGIIVGDQTTHGKGTVQTLLDLSAQLFRIPNAPELGALKITMQQFYRPNGDSTQHRGVVADIKLPALSDHLEGVSESDFDYAVKFDHVDPADYEKANLISKPVVASLGERSAARCKADPDFQKVQKKIERYETQKQKKRVTLNEEKFLAERKELNAEKEAEKEFEEKLDPKEVVKRDQYWREALAITLDFIQSAPKPIASSAAQN